MKSILCLLLLLPLLTAGQSRIGEWSAHVSFNSVIQVEEMPDNLVAATSNGIYFVAKKGFALSSKTKVEGLAEVGISAVAYSPSANILLTGYESGNLDLFQDLQIKHLPDLTRKADLPNKTIHRIICEGNFAFLCTAFGIVKIDLLKMEVSETWYLGPNFDLKEAFDLTSFGNSWWVATNHGIFKADKSGSNLQDYRNWQLQTTLPQPDAGFSSLATWDGLLFANETTNDRILASDGKTWSNRYAEIKNIRRIKSSPNGLLVLADGELWLTGSSGNTRINSYLQGFGQTGIDPRDALVSNSGELWIGDYREGLTRRTNNSSFLHYLPNSPGSDQISAMKTTADLLLMATVVKNTAGTPEAALSIFQAGIWQNLTAADDAGLQAVAPITAFAFGNTSPDEFWASSAGSGLLYFQKNRVFARYNELNSTMGAINGSCKVEGVSLDAQGNLFYANPTGKVRVGTRAANGTFSALPYPGMNFSDDPMGEITTTASGTHWALLPVEGLFACQTKGAIENISDDQYRKVAVQSRFSNGTTTLLSQFTGISSLAEDQNHQLWVGTNSGVVVYVNPDKIFEPGPFYGSQPSIDDGEGLFKPLLDKEKVTAIAVDGGNRKWIGTALSGVFLFSETGDHLLRHFNSQNSPLLSDQILSITISPQSGQVYFATSRGLISYKSDAAAGLPELGKAYVWPNPLRETHASGVTIDGLTEGTEIRITDVTGNLVYKTTSLGGRALWNAQNARGVRVATGVYLIFCYSPQMKSSKIIKLLVIH